MQRARIASKRSERADPTGYLPTRLRGPYRRPVALQRLSGAR
jgi:hypothetical protein